MKILYYTWSEYTVHDMKDVFDRLGYEYLEVTDAFSKYDEDEQFIETIRGKIELYAPDCIFTFNYFPDISRMANDADIIYISWCFDSPLLTLESKTIVNKCNRIFVFDKALYDRYVQDGFEQFYYMPLACNTVRIDRQFAACGYQAEEIPNGYSHDITFLGNLYNDQFDFYSQIEYLPDYLKGYLDAAMDVQMQIYGYNMIKNLLTEDILKECFEYININMGDRYLKCKDRVLDYMLNKQVTVRERRRLLTVIGEYYSLDHYAGKKSDLPVNYCGYAEYLKQMPEIFRLSKINLNITLRTIQSGIPLRIIDILGAGGFCLTNYQSELPDYFENGRELVWYESHEEMFEKIGYYLKHDSERQEIAANGARACRSLFSYDTIVPKIMKLAMEGKE